MESFHCKKEAVIRRVEVDEGGNNVPAERIFHEYYLADLGPSAAPERHLKLRMVELGLLGRVHHWLSGVISAINQSPPKLIKLISIEPPIK